MKDDSLAIIVALGIVAAAAWFFLLRPGAAFAGEPSKEDIARMKLGRPTVRNKLKKFKRLLRGG